MGTNDLFVERCINKLVVASVLNVVKLIYEIKPNSYFIIHGILPRKDDINGKSHELKTKWKYAQAINTQIRKFTEHSHRVYFMQAAPLFLEETESKGRLQINHKLLDGIHPTKEGLEVWGDYIVKKMKNILEDIKKKEAKGLGKQGRLLTWDEMMSNGTIF